MAYGLTNVKGITNEEIAALEEILDDLITLLGATNNTGGTTSAGTVMAKLNKLLTDWTATRAGYIDTINTNAARLTSTRAGYIDKLANFGATGDTGGTASAGTVMAKLNKLLTDWTTARAGRIDTINNAIGATNNTGGTVSAGTVMAKLNQLLMDWTATRAGYLTNLNTRLTATRAGYLDKLANFGATGDTGGSATAGTLMAKLNKLITASSSGLKVKSVQHGFVDKGYATNARYITINSVNTSKSILISDVGSDQGGTYGHGSIPPNLYSSTQIQQFPGNGGGVANDYFPTFNWSIIEFY